MRRPRCGRGDSKHTASMKRVSTQMRGSPTQNLGRKVRRVDVVWKLHDVRLETPTGNLSWAVWVLVAVVALVLNLLLLWFRVGQR